MDQNGDKGRKKGTYESRQEGERTGIKYRCGDLKGSDEEKQGKSATAKQ
jgi:hypothetical protein